MFANTTAILGGFGRTKWAEKFEKGSFGDRIVDDHSNASFAVTIQHIQCNCLIHFFLRCVHVLTINSGLSTIFFVNGVEILVAHRVWYVADMIVSNNESFILWDRIE